MMEPPKGLWVPLVAGILDSRNQGLPPEEIAARLNLPIDRVCWVLENAWAIREQARREFGCELSWEDKDEEGEGR